MEHASVADLTVLAVPDLALHLEARLGQVDRESACRPTALETHYLVFKPTFEQLKAGRKDKEKQKNIIHAARPPPRTSLSHSPHSAVMEASPPKTKGFQFTVDIFFFPGPSIKTQLAASQYYTANVSYERISVPVVAREVQSHVASSDWQT